MLLIQPLTQAPKQQLTIVLPNGNTATMTIYFVPIQQGWFITNLTYGDFVLNGIRIVVSPNILNQFRNLIPFGIACFSDGNREPSLIQDFQSGACKLYLLTPEEVNNYASLLTLGASS